MKQMVEAAENTRPSGQSGETESEEISGMDTNHDTDIAPEDFNDQLSHREVPKWVKSATWIGSIVATLPVLYFLVYPALAILIYRSMGAPQPVPSVLENSIVPIEWVGERNETYQGYTKWLSELML